MSDTTPVAPVAQADLDKCFPKKDGWDIYVFDDKESGNKQYKQDLYHFVKNKSEKEKAVYLNIMRLKYLIQMNYILKQLKQQHIRIPIRPSKNDNYKDWNDVPYFKIDNKEKFRKLISRIKNEETLQKIIPLIDESFTEFNKFKGNDLISNCIDQAKYDTSNKRKAMSMRYINLRNIADSNENIETDEENIPNFIEADDKFKNFKEKKRRLIKNVSKI